MAFDSPQVIPATVPRQSQTCKFSNSCVFPASVEGYCKYHHQAQQLSFSLEGSSAELCIGASTDVFRLVRVGTKRRSKGSQKKKWQAIAKADEVRFSRFNIGGAK